MIKIYACLVYVYLVSFCRWRSPPGVEKGHDLCWLLAVLPASHYHHRRTQSSVSLGPWATATGVTWRSRDWSFLFHRLFSNLPILATSSPFLVEKRSSSARGFNFKIFVNHSDKRMISISTSLINFKVQYHQLAFWFLLQILCYMSFYHNHVQVSDFELVFHRWSNK